ncbi:MAG: hypothetical protein PVI59_17690, partial [Anaerolineae bacterium]|jgi:hypothetical protein
MGAAAGWAIASAPGHFHVVVADMGSQQVCLGRFTTPDGQLAPVHSPRIVTSGEGWSIADPASELGTWFVHRLAPPLVAYLGPPGQEALRDEPRPGDLFRDEIGPARFTAPHGEKIVGFWEQARRLT